MRTCGTRTTPTVVDVGIDGSAAENFVANILGERFAGNPSQHRGRARILRCHGKSVKNESSCTLRPSRIRVGVITAFRRFAEDLRAMSGRSAFGSAARRYAAAPSPSRKL